MARPKKQTEQEKQEDALKMQAAMSGQNLDNDDDLLQNDPAFQHAIIEREYSSGKNIDVVGDIPYSTAEPEDSRPVLDLTSIPEAETFDNNASGAGEGGERRVFDESMSDESKAEQKVLAGNFSESIIDVYKLAIEIAKNGMKKTKEKYQQKALEGKFEMGVMRTLVDFGDGEACTFEEFISGYNDQVSEILSLDPEKEKEMRALLKRIAIKRGLGLSDEARLGIMVAEDVLTKAAMIFNLSKTMANIEKNQLRILNKQNNSIPSSISSKTVQHATKTERVSEDISDVESVMAEIIKENGE
jgi:hypothetical protein